MEFLEITFSRHDTCKLLCDTSLALARSSPTRRYTGIDTTVSVSSRRIELYIVIYGDLEKSTSTFDLRSRSKGDTTTN